MDDLIATEDDIDFPRLVRADHGLSVVAGLLAQNDFLGHDGIIVIPAAAGAARGGIGDTGQIRGNSAAHERDVDTIVVDGALGRHGNRQFAIEFDIGQYGLRHGIEKRSPSGAAVANFRPYTFGFLHERRVCRSGRGRLRAIRIRADDGRIDGTVPAVNTAENIAFEEPVPARVQDAGGKLRRIEWVFPACKCLELRCGQTSIVIRHDDDGFRCIRAKLLFPRVATFGVARLIPRSLSQRTEELFERLSAVNIEAGLEKSRAIAAIGISGQWFRNANGVTSAAVERDLLGLVAQAEHDDFVIEVFRGNQGGKCIQTVPNFGDGRLHAARIVDHPNDVDGEFFDSRFRCGTDANIAVGENG